MRRLLVLAVYPTSDAVTRLRAWQYREYLADQDISLDLWTFFGPRETALWFGKNNLGRVWALARGLLRAFRLIPRAMAADAVLVLRQALPLGPPLLEWIVSRGKPLIWDVDDALWTTVESPTVGRVPQWIRATGNKYHWLCRNANQVWAGNDTVAEWCKDHNEDVRTIPTVLRVPSNRPDVISRGRIVGWIGSPSTGPFLEKILPALRNLGDPPTVEVVGAEVSAPPGLSLRHTTWSKEAERRALERMSVGLYPVDRDHPMAEGKSGFKAILYMAHGIPVVATPTRTNSSIIRHGIEGLHARDLTSWTDSVRVLLEDTELRERISIAAHRRARSHYSLQRWGPFLAGTVKELLRQAEEG